MNLNQISYVIKLAETQNFTRAAQELFITQPTLSQQIKKLEEEVGVSLFNRTRTHITLTKAGEDFLYYAKRIESNVNKLSISLENYCSLDTGSIHIGVLWTFGYTKIPEYIRDFQRIYPQIDVKISVNGSAILLNLLNEGKLDVIFITGSPEQLSNNLEIDLVSQSELMCLINNDHPLASLETVIPEDLEKEKILMVSKNSHMYPILENSFKSLKHPPIMIGESSQADVAIQMATYNMAISFISKEIFMSANPEGIIIKPMYPKIYRRIYMASLSASNHSPVVNAFKHFIVEQLHLTQRDW